MKCSFIVIDEDQINLTELSFQAGATKTFSAPIAYTVFLNRAEMPVFQETADASRDLRILPSRERPLPRLSPLPFLDGDKSEKYEVVVIGVSVGFWLKSYNSHYGIGSRQFCKY